VKKTTTTYSAQSEQGGT